MITIKTIRQIPTFRVVRGFRSGGSRRISPVVEDQRIAVGYAQMQAEEARRQWLREQWQNRILGKR